MSAIGVKDKLHHMAPNTEIGEGIEIPDAEQGILGRSVADACMSSVQ